MNKFEISLCFLQSDTFHKDLHFSFCSLCIKTLFEPKQSLFFSSIFMKKNRRNEQIRLTASSIAFAFEHNCFDCV